MIRKAGATTALAGGLLVLVLSGCGSGGTSPAQAQGTAPRSDPGDPPEVLATLNGDQQVTMSDVRARIGNELDQLEIRYRRSQYKLVEATLQELLRDRVLGAEAERQGTTVDQVLAAELGGSLEPTEVEIAAWYETNQSRTGGRSLDDLRSQITDYLRRERRADAATRVEERLARERAVTIHLEPFRVQFDNAGAPAIGPQDAELTLVEFSDFECPYCARFHPTLKALQERYGRELRIVYRQFPIASIHANAVKAAEASLCAHDQGKFWEMHDILFQEQQRMAIRDLKEKAGRLGLNQGRFNACLDSGKYIEQIQADLEEGKRAGVTGTPALFLNGVPIDGGAVPLETVVKAVEAEKARRGPTSPRRTG